MATSGTFSFAILQLSYSANFKHVNLKYPALKSFCMNPDFIIKVDYSYPRFNIYIIYDCFSCCGTHTKRTTFLCVWTFNNTLAYVSHSLIFIVERSIPCSQLQVYPAWYKVESFLPLLKRRCMEGTLVMMMTIISFHVKPTS